MRSNDLLPVLIVAALPVILLIAWLIGRLRDLRKISAQVSSDRHKLASEIRQFEDDKLRRSREMRKEQEALAKRKEIFQEMLSQTARQFPWIAKIHGDFIAAEADHAAWLFKYKRRPAIRSAELISDIKSVWRQRLEAAKFGQYKAIVYESAFPYLTDSFKDAPTERLATVDNQLGGHDKSTDPVWRFLTTGRV